MIKDDDRARLLARGRNLELMTLVWNQGERQSLSVKARGVRALVDVPTDRSDAGGDVGVARDPQGSDRQVAEGRHHPWSVADPDLRGQPGRVGIPKRLAGGF